MQRNPWPRWLWVAIGTVCKELIDRLLVDTRDLPEPALARSFMIFWAQGQAVIPVTSAPMLFADDRVTEGPLVR